MTKDEIKKQLKELKKQKTALLYEAEKYQKTHGSEFFRPLYYQQQLIDYLWQGKKRLLLQGANQIGKTLIGAALVDSFARGIQEWDKRPSIFNGRPTYGRIVCTDWEYHADRVIVKKLKETIPYGSYVTKRNKQGTEAFWEFKNGSSFNLMTIKQDTQSHESDTIHWIWQDEPGPEDKYSAGCRGLIRNSGIYLLTMTAVGKESWMMDKICLNTGKDYGIVSRVPMRANTYLTEEDIQRFIKDCKESELDARVFGGWLQLSGLVIKNFDSDIHIIEPFEIPPTWPVVPFIDIHLSKPQAISFFAWDRYKRQYQVDEIWDNLSPEQIAYEIIKRKKDNKWNISECGIDPLAKGDAAYLKNRYGDVPDTFTIIEEILDKEGIELFPASKDKDSGIRNIDTALKGVNDMPAMFFFRGKTDMSVKQLQRWIYDDNGIPLKQNDDFPENLYRSTLLESSVFEQRKVPQTRQEIIDNLDYADYLDLKLNHGFGSVRGWAS